jgi:hypothetical protein
MGLTQFAVARYSSDGSLRTFSSDSKATLCDSAAFAASTS